LASTPSPRMRGGPATRSKSRAGTGGADGEGGKERDSHRRVGVLNKFPKSRDEDPVVRPSVGVCRACVGSAGIVIFEPPTLQSHRRRLWSGRKGIIRARPVRSMRWYLPSIVVGGMLGAFGAVLAAYLLAATVRYNGCVAMVPHTTGCELAPPGTVAVAAIFLLSGAILILIGLWARSGVRGKSRAVSVSDAAPQER
jgi:hypothetical protein